MCGLLSHSYNPFGALLDSSLDQKCIIIWEILITSDILIVVSFCRQEATAVELIATHSHVGLRRAENSSFSITKGR